MTDTELIDFLEGLNNEARYTGMCVLRWSEYGRGWRLHETGRDDDRSSTVREAIEKFAVAEAKAKAKKGESRCQQELAM